MANLIHPTLGPKLKAWRRIRKLTLRDLDERSGISYSAIARYEKSDEAPSFENCHRLASALGVPLEILWDLSPAPLVELPEKSLSPTARRSPKSEARPARSTIRG